MAKVHPNAPPPPPPPLPPSTESLTVDVDGKEETMTVWRKSLVFNCRGFTVYDSTGNLAFRVDDYSARGRGRGSSGSKNREMVLMDATGIPLFTIRRRKILSLKRDNWVIYQGEETKYNHPPLFSVARHVTLRHSKLLAHVIPCRSSSSQRYAIEGSYSQRCCTVYDQQQRKAVADICRKECAAPGVTLGTDVFRLVVHPGFDRSLAMAIVLLLDRMYGS